MKKKVEGQRWGKKERERISWDRTERGDVNEKTSRRRRGDSDSSGHKKNTSVNVVKRVCAK